MNIIHLLQRRDCRGSIRWLIMTLTLLTIPAFLYAIHQRLVRPLIYQVGKFLMRSSIHHIGISFKPTRSNSTTHISHLTLHHLHFWFWETRWLKLENENSRSGRPRISPANMVYWLLVILYTLNSLHSCSLPRWDFKLI